MAKFTHYLVTRFNIKINGPGPEWIHSDDRDPDWVSERTKLFEKFCAPSVCGQTNQNFTWLIYCDTETPAEIIERIVAATEKTRAVEIIYVSNFDGLLRDLKNSIQKCQTPFVITTRLDNDDGLSIDFVQEVQSHFIAEDLTILNMLGGVHYHVNKKILTAHRYYLHNSFTSLIEKIKPESLVTIMGFNHLHPEANMKTINIPKKYAFWRNLHEQNTALRGNRGWPILLSPVKNYYSLNFSDINISMPNTIAYGLKWFPRALVRKLIFIAKNKLKIL